MSTLVLAVLIGVVSLLSTVAIVVAVVWALRRASRRRAAEIAESFPEAEVGPELGQYRGGTGEFSRVRNTSWIVLTQTTLVVRPLLGSSISVPVTDITATRIQRTFRSHWNGRPVLVLETARGELGLTIADVERWRTALTR